jgi:hypothetical protein
MFLLSDDEVNRKTAALALFGSEKTGYNGAYIEARRSSKSNFGDTPTFTH